MVRVALVAVAEFVISVIVFVIMGLVSLIAVTIIFMVRVTFEAVIFVIALFVAAVIAAVVIVMVALFVAAVIATVVIFVFAFFVLRGVVAVVLRLIVVVLRIVVGIELVIDSTLFVVSSGDTVAEVVWFNLFPFVVSPSSVRTIASLAGTVLSAGGLELVSAVLFLTLVLIELIDICVTFADQSLLFDISGVAGIVGDVTTSVVVLVSEVIVVGTVVPCAKIVSPATIAVINIVVVSIGVITFLVAEGMTLIQTDGETSLTGDVLVTLIAHTALLLSVITVVVTVNGVVINVDFTGVVAPLVVDGLLGIKMIVGTPLIPGIVVPLVVALTLVTSLSVGVVVVSLFKSVVAITTVAVIFTVGVVFLVAVVLVINAVGSRGGPIVISWSLALTDWGSYFGGFPALNVRTGSILYLLAGLSNGDKSSSESDLKHDYFCFLFNLDDVTFLLNDFSN